MVSKEELRLYRAVYNKRVAQSYIICAGADAEAERAAVDYMLRLFCKNGIGCRICPECKKVLENNHIDILDIDCEGNIKKESVNPVIDFISKRAYEGGYKCVLIRRAHNMGEIPQNFLLKSIEEPPENVVFILTTSAPDKLLPTIRSRSLTVRIPPLSRKEVLKSLGEGESKLAAAAQSGGSIFAAKKLGEDNTFSEARKVAFEIANMLIDPLSSSIFKMSESALSCDFLSLLDQLGFVFRDALYFGMTEDSEYLYNPDRVSDISRIAETISEKGLLQICYLVDKTAGTKRLSPGVNSAAAIHALLFDIMEVKNRCLK